MLGLAQQVGGGDLGRGVAVDHDHQFGRAGGHIDGGAARQGGRLFLGLGHIGVAGTEQLVAGGDDAVFQLDAEGQGGDGLGAAHQPDRVQTRLGGGEDHGGVDAALLVRRGDGDPFAHARDPGRNGQHQQGREQGRCAAGDVEAGRGDGTPGQFRTDTHGGLDEVGVLGPGGLVEDADIVGGHLQGADVAGGQGVAGLGHCLFGDGDAAGRGLVQLYAPVGHGRAAAGADVVEDGADHLSHVAGRALGRAGQGLFLAGGVEGRPVDAFEGGGHHIIFSMGRTSMAEAPAAFSFSRVSQKTAS